LEKIKIAFNYNDDPEYNRQLRMQEDGLNQLTVQEYLTNRQAYLESGRSSESNAAQRDARIEAEDDKALQLMESGLSDKEEAKVQDSE